MLEPIDVEGRFDAVPLGTRFLARRFAAVATRWPERPAVTTFDEALSYSQLQERVESIAERLRSSTPPGPVAISTDDPHTFAVAALAAPTAGRACLFIDPRLDTAATRAMLVRTGVTVLCGAQARPAMGESRVGDVAITVLPPATSDPAEPDGDLQDASRIRTRATVDDGWSDVVTLLNTSGSTGTPRLIIDYGTLPYGRALPDLGGALAPRHVVTNLSMTGVTSHRFMRAILSGDRITFFRLDREPPGELVRGLAASAGTHHTFTPTILRHLAAIALRLGVHMPSVRELRCGGEPLRWSDVRAARSLYGAHVSVINGYGSSEVGLVADYVIPQDESGDDGPVPAGEIVSGRQVTITDPSGRAVPAGTVGVIVVDGIFNTAGIQLEDLGDGRSRFRSGDLGSFDSSGLLHLHGRADRMVKLAGMRVEPASVEDALRAVPGVSDAAVIPLQLGDSPSRDVRLIAHVVVEVGADVTDEVLRTAVAAQLAQVAVPARFVRHEGALPLLSSGKIDFQQLASGHSHQ